MARFMDAVQLISSAKDEGELVSAARSIALSLEIPYFNYGVKLPDIVRRNAPHILSGYDSPWIEHYVREGYDRTDPTVMYSFSNCAPVFWDEGHFAGNRRLRDESVDAGLRHGATIPIHGPHGERGLFCIASPDKDGIRDETLMFCSAIVPFFHQRAFTLEAAKGDSSSFRLPRLTPRELEFVKWMSLGKSCQETADIMGISYRTATFHGQNLLEKFGCSHRYQVIALAVGNGLVF